MLLQQQDDLDIGPQLDLFVVALGAQAYENGFGMLQKLRAAGLKVLMDHEGRSMKKQMKQADKNRARYVLILGDDELAKKEAILKNMASGEQAGVPLSENIEEFVETMKATIS